MPISLFQSVSQESRSPFYRPALAFACLLALQPAASIYAGPGSTRGTTHSAAEREIARREALIQQSQILHTQAALHYDKGEYEEAMRLYRQSWSSLPDAPFTAELKTQARDGYSLAANAQAKNLAAGARYAEARTLLQSILADDFDPDNAEAKSFSEKLDDPDRFEPALTPAHISNVDKVSALLREAYSFINLGDYDSAKARFNDILHIDRYNSAARRGMEQAELHRARYFESARDHARSKALSVVDQAWEAPLADVSTLFGGAPVDGTSKDASQDVITRLRSLILPRVTLQDASLEEVIEFLRIRSREVDPQKRGVDFVLKVPAEQRSKTITLDLQDIPLDEVLRYATQNTNTVYRADQYAVTITSLTERDTTLISRTYRVPPDFIQNTPIDNAAAPTNPFDAPAGGASNLTIRRLGAREILEQRGVPFPEGASATYQPSTSMLIVRNTAENLVLIDGIVEMAQSTVPKQVEIQVRMIEVNETRLNELGFNWLLGQFDVPGTSQRIFGGGGSVGNQRSTSPSGEDFPFSNIGGGPVGANPITSGLRSSGAINGVPSIDALLGRVQTQAVDALSPGQFAVSGVFTDPQFQGVIRALSQSKGVDFLAAPTVVAKSGQRSSVTVSREFRYPTEFDPPQIPQTVGNTGGSTPITPSTPTAFDMRDVGIVLEVEPLIGPDNRTIELNLVPSATEFEGFINYGSAITGTTSGPLGNTIPYDIPNNILQPVFRSNKVNTAVTIWDGQTVVLGGVMFEKVNEINDKVPLLGNVPIIGRAFQSKVKQAERKNVLFFVTVRIIDPAGKSILSLPEATAAAR